MTLMEKIIYLADYIEPNRDFEGLETLRRLCYEDLDAGLEMGFAMSVADLKRRGVVIHANTQGAPERTVNEGRKRTGDRRQDSAEKATGERTRRPTHAGDGPRHNPARSKV